MTIGERIKNLRKKNDLTQEKLADYLCVSYQAVSKWECGLSNPDLSLIAPLTHLFHVSADELLGLSTEAKDGRKAYFDSEYHEFWKKEDKEADYKVAVQAVSEYPGEFRYLEWLATSEFYVAFDDDYRNGGSLEHFNNMIESSIKHYLTILEDCTEEPLRQKAVCGLVLNYKFLNRYDEARKYAEMYPEFSTTTRDDVLEMCLQGEELLVHRQKMLRNALGKLCVVLENLWQYQNSKDSRVRQALHAEEQVIRAVIDDENYNGFYAVLYQICFKRAEISVVDLNYEQAVKELQQAKQYAMEYDKSRDDLKCSYTCLLLDRCADDDTDARKESALTDDWRGRMSECKFLVPIRDRLDFKALLDA